MIDLTFVRTCVDDVWTFAVFAGLSGGPWHPWHPWHPWQWQPWRDGVMAMAVVRAARAVQVAQRAHSRPMEVPAARRLRMLQRPKAHKTQTQPDSPDVPRKGGTKHPTYGALKLKTGEKNDWSLRVNFAEEGRKALQATKMLK